MILVRCVKICNCSTCEISVTSEVEVGRIARSGERVASGVVAHSGGTKAGLSDVDVGAREAITVAGTTGVAVGIGVAVAGKTIWFTKLHANNDKTKNPKVIRLILILYLYIYTSLRAFSRFPIRLSAQSYNNDVLCIPDFHTLEELRKRLKIRHGHSQIFYIRSIVLKDTRASLDETCAAAEFFMCNIAR